MADYRHQCRYCALCVYTMDEEWWCDELDKYISSPKRPNKCAKWLFNAIPADGTLDKEYKPRKKRAYIQDKLFEMPTDKQRAKGFEFDVQSRCPLHGGIKGGMK